MTSYFALSASDQRDLLNAGAQRSGRRPEILEKDIWVCWALQHVFARSSPGRMAFKGGTSLSKAYGIIQRFSEDIDLTLDFRDLELGHDPLDPALSVTARKKLATLAQARVIDQIHSTFLPLIEEAARETTAEMQQPVTVETIAEDTIAIVYPAAVAGYSAYLRSEIRLEFGGRNLTEPSEQRPIVADLANLFPQVMFPSAEVCVLAAERTFWEKVTLIHAACRQAQSSQRQSSARMSRHWYDLAMLADSTVGQAALPRRDLLHSVVAIKEAFFYVEAARYPDCLGGKLCLSAAGEHQAALAKDYGEMVREGLLPEGAPDFEIVTTRLAALEEAINNNVIPHDLTKRGVHPIP